MGALIFTSSLPDKTDSYLLRISGTSAFNYTVECNHPIVEQPMYTMTGEHEANDVDYVWISGVSQGDLVLLDVQIDPYSGWTSVVSDSKAIPIQTSSIGGTHIHEFVADKTDSYLLRISGTSAFNYTVECNHPIVEQPMYTMTGEHEANDVDYVWISGVSQGDLVLLDVQIDPYSGWTSVVSVRF